MDLEIRSYNNYFKLIGCLNKRNIHILEKEFYHFFDNSSSITLSLEGLTNIDKYGLKALINLHLESIKKQKRLAIIGFGNKELYDYFKSATAA